MTKKNKMQKLTEFYGGTFAGKLLCILLKFLINVAHILFSDKFDNGTKVFFDFATDGRLLLSNQTTAFKWEI